jgi:tRNA dimethylallyltransferase
MSKMVAIVGPTAAGKSELALRLAEEFEGEIVCADSRTVYRGMDIGTAKPTVEERKRVGHYLLDVADPEENLSAAVFKVMAQQAIAQVRSRGKLPILVGGSGLYIYSVLYDFEFPAGPRTAQREELEKLPLSELVRRLEREDPDQAVEIDLKNARRVIRALETVGQPRLREMKLPPGVLLLGLRPAPEDLAAAIERRTEAMFELGLVEEVAGLIRRYGPALEVLGSPGYAETRHYLAGDIKVEEARALIILHTRQLVKRQLTWFKRNPEILWLEGSGSEVAEQAMRIVRGFLRSS